MKKYQIFLSSTFTDLKEARRITIEQILNLGHIPVGMELFQAGNESQWEYIKKRIIECDYYLLIIGDRYGSTTNEGVSYTELEYRFAIEHKIPVASFILSKEAREELPRNKIEVDPKALKRLEKFRKLVQSKMVQFWSENYELAAKISSSLPELMKLNPRPGLIPFKSVEIPDPFNKLRINHGTSFGIDKDVEFYDVLYKEFPNTIIEAQGLRFYKGENKVIEQVEFKELIPNTRIISWRIEEAFNIIYNNRDILLPSEGIEYESFSSIFMPDISKKFNLDYKNLCNKYSADWCTLWSYSDNGIYEFVKKLVDKGFLSFDRIAPGRDNLSLRFTARILLGLLEKFDNKLNIKK